MLRIQQVKAVNKDGATAATDGSLVVVTPDGLAFTSEYSGGVVLPKGTSAERPSTVTEPLLRYNTDTFAVEGNTGSGWFNVNKLTTFADEAAAAASTLKLSVNDVVHIVDDANGVPRLVLITGLDATATYAGATKWDFSEIQGDTHNLIVSEFDAMTTALTSVNASSPTSALQQAFADGLVTFANVLGQGTIDLPDIVV